MREMFQSEPLLLIGLILLAGFYVGGLARKARLPSLIGFMIFGVCMGPSLLGYIAQEHLESFSFITEIALGFVAFTIGAELDLGELRKLGRGIISIIFAESFTAFFVVLAATYAVTRSWPMALLFGAVAPASAPAGTVAVIQECRARGSLTKALYAVVGFDDGLAILIYGFAAALAKILLLDELGVDRASGGLLGAMIRPGLEVAGSLLVGTVMGFAFCHMVRNLQTSRDILILTSGAVFICTGIAEHFHLSLILTNMVLGFFLVNTRRQALVHRVVAPLQEIMPMLFLLFFTLAGAHLKVGELPSLGFIGIVYILARSAGLIGGARIGGMMGNVEEKIKRYIGLGILSQAGVAIGLSLITRHDFEQLVREPLVAKALENYALIHPDVSPLFFDPLYIGATLITTITATCIVFEIIGPILTKYALSKAGEIPHESTG